MKSTYTAKSKKEIKEILFERKISVRKIARDSGINDTSINNFLSDEFTGSKEMEQRIIKCIEFVLQGKTNLNPKIFGNVNLMIRVFDQATLNPKFNRKDRAFLFELIKDLEKYKSYFRGIKKFNRKESKTT